MPFCASCGSQVDGKFCPKCGDYSAARTCFQQALAAAPRDFLTRFQLGIAEEHLGLFSAALENISEACKIAPQAAACRTKIEQLKLKTN